MKETKEILDNILRMKKSEYELFESSASSESSKTLEEKHHDKVNVLSGEAVVDLEEKIDNMENYEPTQQAMAFKADDVKDFLEKKKKRRNYIEFRSDYEKS